MPTVPISPHSRVGPPAVDPHWHGVRLPEAMRALERALAAHLWEGDAHQRLAEPIALLRQTFIDHVVATEGPSGLYAELLERAPRLARRVHGLVCEHAELLAAMDRLQARVRGHDRDHLRSSARDLVVHLWRHRQRGADLVYEAYDTDIGGET